MANRTLGPEELVKAGELLDQIRHRLKTLSQGDDALHFAYRRKVYKELTYDERGKPGHRKKLKARKRDQQQGRCPECADVLPERNAVLDRLQAQGGYTDGNTRLLCPDCDRRIQAERGFS